METDYSEIDADPDDVTCRVLTTLADGSPWVFLVIDSGDGGLEARAQTGGIKDARVLAAVLRLCLNSIPATERGTPAPTG